jgi:acetyltransferase EpsM
MKILIWGGKSFTRISLQMLKDLYQDNFEITGIFDHFISELAFKSNIKFYNKKNDLNNLIKSSTHYLLCIGGANGYARVMIANKLNSFGLKTISLISKHSILEDLSYKGEGIQSMPGAIVNKYSYIGNHCILNTNSSVDHECEIQDGVHIMGGASISGRVVIGQYSSVGTNATILPDINIGKNVYIGAGSVVTKDVKDNSVIVGVPGKFLKEFKPKLDLKIFD